MWALANKRTHLNFIADRNTHRVCFSPRMLIQLSKNVSRSTQFMDSRFRSLQRADKCCFCVPLQNFAISSILNICARYSLPTSFRYVSQQLSGPAPFSLFPSHISLFSSVCSAKLHAVNSFANLDALRLLTHRNIVYLYPSLHLWTFIHSDFYVYEISRLHIMK